MTISATTQGLKPGVVTSSNRPANPYDGMMIYETDTNLVRIWNGTAWKTLSYSDYTNGTVLQVVSAEYSTQTSSSTTTYADTGLTLAITPSSTSSKVLVQITQSYGRDDGNSLNSVGLKLFRGATDLGVFATRAGFTNTAIYQSGTVAYNYLDSPATTSATTYKTQFNNALVSSGFVYAQYVSAKSTITLMEIAG